MFGAEPGSNSSLAFPNSSTEKIVAVGGGRGDEGIRVDLNGGSGGGAAGGECFGKGGLPSARGGNPGGSTSNMYPITTSGGGGGAGSAGTAPGGGAGLSCPAATGASTVYCSGGSGLEGGNGTMGFTSYVTLTSPNSCDGGSALDNGASGIVAFSWTECAPSPATAQVASLALAPILTTAVASSFVSALLGGLIGAIVMLRCGPGSRGGSTRSEADVPMLSATPGVYLRVGGPPRVGELRVNGAGGEVRDD